MTLDHDHHPMREAIYCRSTGCRLAPEQGLAPAPGVPVAVAVFDDGESVPLFGDSVLGRSPGADRRVRDGSAVPIALTDRSRRLSRCHAMLRVHRWEVDAIDLGSRNGTEIEANDGSWRRIMPGLGVSLRDGSRLRLASRAVTIYHLQH